MRLDRIGLTKLDVDPAAIGKTTRFSGSEVFVCVSNALVKLFFELVLFSIGIRIAGIPNYLDELLALLVGLKFFPGVSLCLSEDRVDIIDPIDIRLLQFLF
jgi:hypothetical protein